MVKEFQKEEMHVSVKKKKNYARNLKINTVQLTQGFLGGSDGKESTCQCRTPGFHSLGWEDSPGGGNDNPPQYSSLENPTDRAACWVTQSQTRLSD